MSGALGERARAGALTVARRVARIDWLAPARWARAWPLDAALLVVALALAAFTLFYPFGRDQGLYHYVGREWFRGQVPYRDVMEQKTPLIYLIFGGANLLFGERFVSYRIVELAWVLALGVIIGTAATPRGEAPTHGLRGASAVALVLCYMGVLDFWNTAQCEVWATGLALASLAVVERRLPGRRPAFWAGVLGGLAILAKPTAAVFMAVVGLAAIERALTAPSSRGRRVRDAAEAAGLIILGALSPFALLGAYFAAHRALPDVYDVLVKCNAYYVEHESTTHTREEAWAHTVAWFREHKPLSDIALATPAAGLALALARWSWDAVRRHLVAAALMAAAVAGIAAQRKFYIYHWGAFLVVVPLALACAAYDAGKLLARFDPPRARWATALCTVALLGAFAHAFLTKGAWGPRFLSFQDLTWRYARGRVARETYLATITRADYDLRAQEVIGHWLAAHTRPDEYVALRNFEPAMYLVARRRAPTRFFWTPWLAWGSRAYRRREWLAQDAAQLRANPPRYIVTVARFREGAESPNYYRPEYEDRFQYGEFLVMERVNTYLEPDGRAARVRGRAFRAAHVVGTFDDGVGSLAGWQVEGDAFESQPRDGAAPGQTEITNARGAGFVNTFHPAHGDRATGVATSPPFTARAGAVLMLLVGGGDGDDTCVELLDGDAVARRFPGARTERLTLAHEDLTPFAGRQLRVRIVDRATGAWGHVLADHIAVMEPAP